MVHVGGDLAQHCRLDALTLLCLLASMQACKAHGVAPGVFCLGQARAAALAQQGFAHVGYDTDLNILINYSSSTAAELTAK